MSKNITRATHQYIREHHSVAECLDRGLVNYSALAREICSALKIDAFDAVLIACRRYHQNVKKSVSHERKVTGLIKGARIRIRTKMSVLTIDKSRTLEKAFSFQKRVKERKGDFSLIEGEDAFTIMTNSEFLIEAKQIFEGRIKKVSADVAQITMIFDESVGSTAGVVASIYRILAENDINLLEEMSCWTDILMVIDAGDLSKAVQLLGA